MKNEFKDLGFAGAVSQSRSVQALVRVMNLFGAKYPGGCSISLSKGRDDGVEIHFGASDKQASEHGLDDFLGWLALTDQLILLEAIISSLRDRGAPAELINAMVEEAHLLVKKLYPDAKVVTGDLNEKT